ncbi:transposase family protein [Nocardia sp. GAS34]|uniref:transposase family protein n=1 Tax=unclassified Nocardia TaxID=2637762 RepID=UPI003D214678
MTDVVGHVRGRQIPRDDARGSLDVLGLVKDPRKRRGRRFGLASILLVALAATLAGSRSFAAIGEWAGDAPGSVLGRLGVEVRRRVRRPSAALCSVWTPTPWTGRCVRGCGCAPR